MLKESFERITALYEAGADVTGAPSGFRDLDRLTSGFQPGNLIIIAARPSMGKSALGLCVAANLALRHEIPVALFELAGRVRQCRFDPAAFGRAHEQFADRAHQIDRVVGPHRVDRVVVRGPLHLPGDVPDDDGGVGTGGVGGLVVRRHAHRLHLDLVLALLLRVGDRLRGATRGRMCVRQVKRRVGHPGPGHDRPARPLLEIVAEHRLEKLRLEVA